MSYSFDGKIVNQAERISPLKNICACCSKSISYPTFDVITLDDKKYGVLSYLDTEYFIYESKGSKPVVYCSDKCRRKHNHRFTRRKDLSAEYEQKLENNIYKLEDHIRKNLRVGDEVLDTLTNSKVKIVQILEESWQGQAKEWQGRGYILDVDENVRYGWEIELVIE